MVGPHPHGGMMEVPLLFVQHALSPFFGTKRRIRAAQARFRRPQTACLVVAGPPKRYQPSRFARFQPGKEGLAQVERVWECSAECGCDASMQQVEVGCGQKRAADSKRAILQQR